MNKALKTDKTKAKKPISPRQELCRTLHGACWLLLGQQGVLSRAKKLTTSCSNHSASENNNPIDWQTITAKIENASQELSEAYNLLNAAQAALSAEWRKSK